MFLTRYLVSHLLVPIEAQGLATSKHLMWGIEFRMLYGVDLPNLAGDLFCHAEAVAVVDGYEGTWRYGCIRNNDPQRDTQAPVANL